MEHLYIHIPFCVKKCLYCDFNSYSGKENLIEDYIIALKKEIQSYNLNDLKTVYIGGGTPSAINEKYIEEIIKTIENKIKSDTEITIEVNPGTVDETKLKAYKKIGINRISIGLQATQNNILKTIGRIHTIEEFQTAYDMVRKVRFENVNVDLMFGLPDQTLDNVKESVEYIVKINPEHVSCYSLILHNDIFKNLPDEETEREMYYYIVETLKQNGYIHYEISNFAKEGYKSKHNLSYWNQEEYAGVGAGASSYVDDKRYTNETDIQKYINHAEKNIEEIQTYESKINEYMILQLRLIDGIDVDTANKKFKIDILEKYKDIFNKLEKQELINVTKTNVKLTKKGLDFANIVWEEFV